MFVRSRHEKAEGGHGNEERKRQCSMLAGSREESGPRRQQQGRVLLGEVLLLGSASRHLLCSPFSWERAFKQNLLGRKCAGALCVGFPALHMGQRQDLGTRSSLDSTCEMHFPPE